MEKELKKQKLDMLNGSIWNKLPVFALPIAATGILEQLFNASDIAIVGNFAQTDKTAAVAAVGANSPIIGLILNLFIGIALGANVVIANAIGRDDRQTVQKAVHTSMVVSVIGGVLVAIIGELIAEPLLTVLNVPDDVLELALLYLRIYFLEMPLIALTLSGILNVLLNLFFVIVLKMSVNGVATATVLANVVSAGILYIKLVKSDKYIKVEFKKLRIDGKVFAKIMQIGLPAGIQSAVFAVANIVIQGAINSLGTVVIAASSAAFNIEIIAYNVMNSFSQACTTFVGQNFGANKIDRCKKTLFLCLIEDAIASGTAILIVLITGKFLLSIFNNNPEVIEIGYTRLVIIFIAYIFSMLYEVMSGYLRGFGFSLVPAILTTVGVCVLRIIWINTVFPANRTFVTIMTAYPVSLATTALLIFIALIIYRPSKRFANKGKEKA